MDKKAFIQCLVLVFCQNPRRTKEVPHFLRLIQSLGVVMRVEFPDFEDPDAMAAKTVEELIRQKLLRRESEILIISDAGRDIPLSFRDTFIRTFGVNLEKITALTIAVDNAFNCFRGEPLAPPNPFMPGLIRALQL